MKKYVDLGTLAVIAVTMVLFVLAVLLKGVGKELLLEAGVFLVSIKLILMSYKNTTANEALQKRLDTVIEKLEGLGVAGEGNRAQES
jgi:ABC-type transport system involved in multi-copper enzyme maturation permease subunit